MGRMKWVEMCRKQQTPFEDKHGPLKPQDIQTPVWHTLHYPGRAPAPGLKATHHLTTSGLSADVGFLWVKWEWKFPPQGLGMQDTWHLLAPAHWIPVSGRL